MNLRSFNIGARLGAGFGLILLSTVGMLGLALFGAHVDRQTLLQTLETSARREAQATAMQTALLGSAVAVRNMGLQTTVDAVQRDEAEAKKQRANYLAAMKELEASELSASEREPLTRLAADDREMAARLTEAVDFAATFNAEQAAAVITQKIDPLLKRALVDLGSFTALQKTSAARAADTARDEAARAERLAVVAAVLVTAVSVALAWRLTTSITRPLRAAEHAATRVAGGDLAFDIVRRTVEKGVLMFGPVGPGGSTVKICPPLVISPEAIEDSAAAFGEAVAEAVSAR